MPFQQGNVLQLMLKLPSEGPVCCFKDVTDPKLLLHAVLTCAQSICAPQITRDDTTNASIRGFMTWSQGEQVFISYGRQSNDSLLQYYGFVEPSIAHDTYTLPDLRAAALALGDSLGMTGVNSLPQSSKVNSWTSP